jgi:hypothetical protein
MIEAHNPKIKQKVAHGPPRYFSTPSISACFLELNAWYAFMTRQNALQSFDPEHQYVHE